MGDGSAVARQLKSLPSVSWWEAVANAARDAATTLTEVMVDSNHAVKVDGPQLWTLVADLTANAADQVRYCCQTIGDHAARAEPGVWADEYTPLWTDPGPGAVPTPADGDHLPLLLGVATVLRGVGEALPPTLFMAAATRLYDARDDLAAAISAAAASATAAPGNWLGAEVAIDDLLYAADLLTEAAGHAQQAIDLIEAYCASNKHLGIDGTRDHLPSGDTGIAGVGTADPGPADAGTGNAAASTDGPLPWPLNLLQPPRAASTPRPALPPPPADLPLLPQAFTDTWHRIADLFAAGRVSDLEAWVTSHAHKTSDQLRQALNELTVAAWLADTHPGHHIRLALEDTAPTRPGTSERAEEFDIAIETPDGQIIERVEVFTVDEPVRFAKDLVGGVEHAVAKARRRRSEGLGLVGALHAATVIVPAVGTWVDTSKNQRLVHHSDGTLERYRLDTGQAIGNRTNIYDGLLREVSRAERQGLLDRVSIHDFNGALKAEYIHGPDGWKRER